MDSTNLIDDHINNGSLTITPPIKNFLLETSKWAKFLAILGFIGSGILILVALGMIFFMSSLASSIGNAGPLEALGGGFLGVIYLAMAALYVMPSLYLWRFATKMKTALMDNDQGFLSYSFENLKSCYKFLGIMMAIIVGFYAVGILIGIVAGGAALFM